MTPKSPSMVVDDGLWRVRMQVLHTRRDVEQDAEADGSRHRQVQLKLVVQCAQVCEFHQQTEVPWLNADAQQPLSGRGAVCGGYK